MEEIQIGIFVAFLAGTLSFLSPCVLPLVPSSLSFVSGVGVEATEMGDHYDPQARKVRLSPANYSGHSLTAVTVATHEVGHAIQHARGEVLFDYRQRLVRAARMIGHFLH